MNPVFRTPFSHPCHACNGSGIYYDPKGPFDAVGEVCASCLGAGIEMDRHTYRHDDCSHPDAYFSRIEPMGYYCTSCGEGVA